MIYSSTCDIIITIITDRKVGFEFKDRNLELLNQPVSFIPFSIKIRLLKPKWKSISKKSCFFERNKL